MDRSILLLLGFAVSGSIVGALLLYVILPYYRTLRNADLNTALRRDLTEEESRRLELVAMLIKMTKTFAYVLISAAVVAVVVAVITFRIA